MDAPTDPTRPHWRDTARSERHARAQAKIDAAKKRVESEEAARKAEKEECDAWRTRMRLMLDAYARTLSETTDLAERKVWAFGALTIIEMTSSMKLLSDNWEKLRLAFGHDSKTITQKVIGSDFEERLAKALDEFESIEQGRAPKGVNGA